MKTDIYQLVLECVPLERCESRSSQPGTVHLSNGHYDPTYGNYEVKRGERGGILEEVVKKLVKDGSIRAEYYGYGGLSKRISLKLTVRQTGPEGDIKPRRKKKKTDQQVSHKPKKPARDSKLDNPGFDFNRWYNDNISGQSDRPPHYVRGDVQEGYGDD